MVGVDREPAENRNRLGLLAEPPRMARKIKKNQTQRRSEKSQGDIDLSDRNE